MKRFKRFVVWFLRPWVVASYESSRRDLLGLSMVVIVGTEEEKEEARKYLDKVRKTAKQSKETLEKFERWAA